MSWAKTGTGRNEFLYKVTNQPLQCCFFFVTVLSNLSFLRGVLAAVKSLAPSSADQQ